MALVHRSFRGEFLPVDIALRNSYLRSDLDLYHLRRMRSDVALVFQRSRR